jgi:hypothetical protein
MEYIRENYNKILLNIQKMITSSQPLTSHRNKYEKNKSSFMEVINNNQYKNADKDSTYSYSKRQAYQSTNGTMTMEKEKEKITIEDNTMDSAGREWLEKINNDIETINKEQTRKRTIVKKDKENSSKSCNYSGINI